MGAFRPNVAAPVDKFALPFEQMILPARNLKEQNWNSYRVYKNATEFVTVEGEAAYEAIAKSGVAKPLRVVRTMKEVGDILTSIDLLEQTEGAKPDVEKVPDNGIIAPPSVA